MRKKLPMLALMIAAASILFSVESLIPSPLPLFRLGLANVVTLLALRWWGLKETLIIVVFRTLVASLLTGRLMQPVFVLSLGGGLAAALMMWVLMRATGPVFSLVGISIWGAAAKNAAQLAILAWIYISGNQVFSLLPVFLPMSLISGSIIGLLALLLEGRLSGLLVGKVE